MQNFKGDPYQVLAPLNIGAVQISMPEAHLRLTYSNATVDCPEASYEIRSSRAGASTSNSGPYYEVELRTTSSFGRDLMGQKWLIKYTDSIPAKE